MTSERLRRVEDICNAALLCAVEQRTAFLMTACAGDDELQREIESLLAQEHNAAGFLSVPATAVAVSAVLDHAIGTFAGRRFGVYAMGSLIGVGGMGEVYRARDETLGREVAIKLLPGEFTADPKGAHVSSARRGCWPH
jgi:serine/threonine protein kinase